MENLELQNFTLVDIINEFHEDQPEEAEVLTGPDPEETPEETAEELPEGTVEETAEASAEETAEEEPAVTGDTIRLDSPELLKGEVHNAEHVDDEKDMQETENPDLAKQVPPAEQFTVEWEPE